MRRVVAAAVLLGVCGGCRERRSQAPLTSVVPLVGLPPITIALSRPGLDIRPMPTAEAVAASEKTVRVAAEVESLLLERRPVRLGYPAELASRKVPGFVRFRVIIGRDGAVEGLTLMETTNNLFVPVATASVQSWMYKPYLVEGRSIAVDTMVRVEFGVRE